MAYKVIILYRLYMPSYFLGTFTEYPYEVTKLYGNGYRAGELSLRQPFYHFASFVSSSILNVNV